MRHDLDAIRLRNEVRVKNAGMLVILDGLARSWEAVETAHRAASQRGSPMSPAFIAGVRESLRAQVGHALKLEAERRERRLW